MNQDYSQSNPYPQSNPGAGGPPPQQPGVDPHNQQNASWQQQQANPQNPSLADELRQCWEAYQRTRKIADEFGDNEELKRVVEETAHQQFKEQAKTIVSAFVKNMGNPAFNPKQPGAGFGPTALNKLYRSEKEKMIAGVCGGLSEYFNFDVTVIRVLFVIAALPTPFTYCLGLIIYIVMAIILPVKTVRPV